MYGLSQRDAARLLGVNPTQLMLWEKGSRIPEIKNLFKIGALYRTLGEEIYYEIRQQAVSEIHQNIAKYGGIDALRSRARPP